ncbi:MAG TPA: hypothetical protein PLH72_18720 [Vicinamibacterales bacterium]|nr:hypothetical protein [Vicinamibacterales bacterium]
MSAFMDAQNVRAATLLANFAAGANRDGLIKAVVDITKEVERHATAIDPRETTAVSVLVDLVAELAQGMRHLANIMDTDAHPAPIIVEGPKWPANMLEPEVTP